MTTIKGPYDHHPRDDVERSQVAIPRNISDDLFKRMFPERAFRDRLLAIFVDWFYQRCIEEGVPLNCSKDNEEFAKEILKPLTK